MQNTEKNTTEKFTLLSKISENIQEEEDEESEMLKDMDELNNMKYGIVPFVFSYRPFSIMSNLIKYSCLQPITFSIKTTLKRSSSANIMNLHSQYPRLCVLSAI